MARFDKSREKNVYQKVSVRDMPNSISLIVSYNRVLSIGMSYMENCITNNGYWGEYTEDEM